MGTVLITGGTGLVGTGLAKHLVENGHKVIILSRNPSKYKETAEVSYAAWDIKSGQIDVNAFNKADHIFHLAGAGVVDKKWTASYKQEIRNSRILSSKLIADTLKTTDHKVKSITSSSAIGWYGPDRPGMASFREVDPPATDFLGETCRLWEERITTAAAPGITVCKLRTGIVLSNDGGALPEFKKSLRFGVAGIMGGGRQMMSWIHIDDLCRLFIYSMDNSLNGSYNAVSPAPVTNKSFTLLLAEKMKGKFFIPLHVPAFLLKIMLGERSIEVLKSTTVSASKISAAGFTFLFPSIESALNDLIVINHARS